MAENFAKVKRETYLFGESIQRLTGVEGYSKMKSRSPVEHVQSLNDHDLSQLESVLLKA